MTLHLTTASARDRAQVTRVAHQLGCPPARRIDVRTSAGGRVNCIIYYRWPRKLPAGFSL